MDTYSYYNVHSHKPVNDGDVLTIQNFYTGFEDVGTQFCSMGLHPWYLEYSDTHLPILQRTARHPNVLAIGECGLDKVKGAQMAVQQDIFEQQILLANKLNKPLIVHCVQAHEEVLQLFKHCPPEVPVIFHGFNKKRAIADRLWEQGYYLSFGAAILKASPAAEVLAYADVRRFFLETDDADVTIQEVYKKAAQLRNTDEETFILQLGHNFNAVFGL